jgi:hypothetical protein
VRKSLVGAQGLYQFSKINGLAKVSQFFGQFQSPIPSAQAGKVDNASPKKKHAFSLVRLKGERNHVFLVRRYRDPIGNGVVKLEFGRFLGFFNCEVPRVASKGSIGCKPDQKHSILVGLNIKYGRSCHFLSVGS